MALACALALAPGAGGEQAASQQLRFQHGLLDAGGAHTCAVRPIPFSVPGQPSRGVSCWGEGSFGQLGYAGTENIGDNETPAARGYVSLGATPAAIASGWHHTCALLTTGAVRCWGDGYAGRLGYGDSEDIGDNETPAARGNVPLGAPAMAITAGGEHTCAVLEGGVVRCWGINDFGQLGYGDTEWIGDDETPASKGPVQLRHQVREISAGRYHTCALIVVDADSSVVSCWGFGFHGQLGYGDTENVGDDETPAPRGGPDYVPLGTTVTGISAGELHTCALVKPNGGVRCWGSNEHGQLGYGHTENIGDDERPAPVDGVSNVPLGAPAAAVAAGRAHSCALLTTGAVRCWGLGTNGRLGYGDTETIGDDETPASKGNVPLGAPAIAITAGDQHTCALLSSAAVRCWGAGGFGPLGYGDTENVGDDETPASKGNVPLPATRGRAALELFVASRLDRFYPYRYLLVARLSVPRQLASHSGVADKPTPKLADCTGTTSFVFAFAGRLRAIRTRPLRVTDSGTCFAAIGVTLPRTLSAFIIRRGELFVIRSLARFNGNDSLASDISNGVAYAALPAVQK